MTSRHRHLITIVGAAAGSALFAYAIYRAGINDILEGIRRVGWGLVAILVLAGLRFLLRAEAWRFCVPPSVRLGHRQAFAAFLAGDSVGSVTPLGLVASEPTKVFLTRHHLATRESVASLALDNLVYAASIVAMVALGVLVLLLTVPVPPAWRWAGLATLAALAMCAAIVPRIMRGTWDDGRGARPWWRERLASVRMAVLGYSVDHPARLWRVLAFDLLFHALAVVEIYITLQWLLAGRGVTLSQAVIFEALNRVVTVAFKFVPFRIGVDEALTGGMATVLAMDPAAGVTLAVVRKIRNLAWSGVGMAIVVAHPARSEQNTRRADGAEIAETVSRRDR